MKMNFILPPHIACHRHQESEYLLRKHRIWAADLIEAAVALWEPQVHTDRCERMQRIADYFRHFLSGEQEFRTQQMISRVIERVLIDLQTELGKVLDPYIDQLMATTNIRLSVLKFLEDGLVIQITLDPDDHDVTPAIPNHPTNG
jgi:hypothetical protein